MHDAFRRLSAQSGLISRQVFVREVVGDGLPPALAEQIYGLCNGGLAGTGNSNGTTGFTTSSNKGLNFREVLTFLVLVTRGSREEKIKCKLENRNREAFGLSF